MNERTLSSQAEEYFYTINPLAKRIGEDITATKEAYEGIWNALSITERNQAINETIIRPEIALKYTSNKLNSPKNLPEWYPKLRIQTGTKYIIDETGNTMKWRDEHSEPFSFMTQSQLNLDLIDGNQDVTLKSHFGESPQLKSPIKSHKPKDSLANSCYQNDSYLDTKIDNNNIFTKLINRTTLLKLKNNSDDDMECLVAQGSASLDASETNSLVMMLRTKSSDITESTALLETPSSYGSSLRSSQLNQDGDEAGIPKTGFEFLDNW